MLPILPLLDLELDRDSLTRGCAEALLLSLTHFIEGSARGDLTNDLRRLGVNDVTVPTVLADGFTCDRFAPRARAAVDHRVDAWSGEGSIDAATVMDDWRRASVVTSVDAPLRRRLRRCLPHPLPPIGSRVVLLDLDALHRLERSVHALGHAHIARLKNLTVLAWQRGVLWAALGADGAGAHALVHHLHCAMLEHERAKRRSRPALLGWLGDLAVDHSEPSSEPGAGILDKLRSADTLDGDVWRRLVQAVRRAGLHVVRVSDHPPEGEAGHGINPPRVLDLLHQQIEGEDAIDWRQGGGPDYLGLYVSSQVRWATLPPGVHLFCNRIEVECQQHQLDLATLGWQVLWHEFAHWKLDDQGIDRSRLDALGFLDIEEVLCEVVGYWAVERGSYLSVLPLHTTPRRRVNQLIAWRDTGGLLPYAWFPRVLLPASTVSWDTWMRFTIAAREALVRCDAWYAGLGGEAQPEELHVIQRLLDLLSGRMPPEVAQGWIQHFAQAPQPRSRGLERPVVYLWSKMNGTEELGALEGEIF